MSECRRSVKLKDRKKEIFPFMPLRCGLDHRQTSTLQGLHISVAIHNCVFSLKSRRHLSGDAPGKPPTNSYLESFSLLARHPNLFFFKQSFMVSIHLFCCLPSERLPGHSHIDPISNTIILHSFHMAEPSENTFINPFVHPFRHSGQLLYLCIRDFVHSSYT